ncbi:MAG: hypothetical protein RLP44_20995 [Aggregatilineales bacterium]
MSIKNVCEHIANANGVHEFIFEDSSRAAVDFLMDSMSEIIAVTPIDDPIMMMIDLSKSGVPPLRYAMMRSKKVNSRYLMEFENKKQHQAYLAMISTNTLIHTFKVFVEQMVRGNTKIKIFKDRESAMAWLGLVTDTHKENAG